MASTLPQDPRPPAILPSEKRPLQLSLFSLPTLCCACHRLKAGPGKWSRRRVDQNWFPRTAFSHGICPSCYKARYPSAYRRRQLRRAGGTGRLPLQES